MPIIILIGALFLASGGLLLWGAVAYRGQGAGRDMLWTSGAALLLLLLFAVVR